MLLNAKYRKPSSSPSIGLGDSVEKFTKATGIKKIVNKISESTGKPCGCGERKDTLNRIFPYKKK
jgi:hypothetical protein